MKEINRFILKNILKLFFFFLIVGNGAFASHIMGFDLYYECIGQDTFRIWVYFYKDCSGCCQNPDPPGSGAGPNFSMTVFPGGCGSPVPLGPWVTVLDEEVTPICPSITTKCTNPGASINGVRRQAWYRDYDFSSTTCDSVRIVVDDCCRNNAITTINNPGSTDLTIYTTIDLTLPDCNSSPQFGTPPVPYLCWGQPFTFNQQAFDYDGDSIVYRFGPCLDAIGTPVSYINPPYSATNPIQSTPPIAIDPLTGDITLTPPSGQAQVAVVCVYVEEWRNGVKIGEIWRDMQITVLDCGAQQIPQIAGIDSTWIFVDTVCAHVPLSFEIPVYDPNLSDPMTMTWDGGIPGATFTVLPGNRKAIFSWPDPIPRSQPYIFKVTANDNACPINGITTASFVLYVRESQVQIEDTVSVNCNTAYFSAPATGGYPPYTYTWTGDAGLSSNLPAFSYTYSNSGTYQYIVKVEDGAGCFDQDTGYVTINADEPLKDTGILDTAICQFDTLVVTYPGDTSGGLQVYWDFGSGASPKTISSKGPHQVRWNLAGQKIIKLTLIRGTCQYMVYDTIQVLPAPIVDAGQNLTLCAFTGLDTLNAQVIAGGGGAICQFQWWPSKGLSNPNVKDPIVYPDTTRTYYVRANCNGCWSQPDSVKITVLPAPKATITKPIYYYCIGTQGVQLQANVTGGTPPLYYQWSPSYALSNPFILNPLASPSVDTIYRFVAVDKNGCPSDTLSVKVIVTPRPLAYARKDTAICSDGPGVYLQGVGIDTFGFGSFQYQWIPSTGLSNPNIANPYAKPDSTTIYTLIVTNSFTGCSSDPTDTSSTVTVKVIPKPIANAGPPEVEICYQDSVQLGDVSMGSQPGYTYEWSPGIGLNDSTLPRPMANPPHTMVYYLRVFNQGCASDVDSIKVIVKPYPRVIIIPGPYEMCFGDTIQIRTQTTIHSGSYSGPITYQWTPTPDVITPTEANPYVSPSDTTVLKVYASTPGCPLIPQDSTIVIVDYPPTITIDSSGYEWPLTICKGDSIQLHVNVTGIEPYTLQWTPMENISDPYTPAPIVYPEQTTTYTLTAQYKNCKSQDSIPVYVEGGFTVSLTADRSYVCDGDTLKLIAEGGIGNPSFLWNPSVLQWRYLTPTRAEAIVIPTDTTTFIVTAVEGKAQCADSDSVTVFWYPKVRAQFEAVPTRGCDTLKVTFRNQSQGDQYWLWDFGDGTISNEQNPIHAYTQPGTYFAQLIVNRNNICPDSSTLTVPIQVFSSPILQINSNPEGVPVEIGLPNAFVSFHVQNLSNMPIKLYYWNFGDGQYSHESDPTHRYSFPGEFEVTLTVVDENECEQTFKYGPIIVLDPTFEAPNVFTPNGDGINDIYYFSYEGNASFGAEIYDRFGKLVFKTSNPKEGWNGRIMNDGAEAVEGTYFYIVRIGDSVYRGQITLIR